MSNINHFNIRGFDLNLLIAFDALMHERNVTRAAARLRIQQPAMSHSLKMLRLLFADELFVRIGHTMQPTERAQQLSPMIHEILQKAESTILFQETFKAETSVRVFRIGVSAQQEVDLLPRLMAHIHRIAPGIKILATQALRREVHSMLNNREIDLAIGCFDAAESWHHTQFMYDESMVCCYNAALTGYRAPLSLPCYLDAQHALITFSDNMMGCVEEAFRLAETSLKVSFSTGNFLSLLHLAQHSPVVVTLPSRIAQQYAALFQLSISAVPLALGRFRNQMMWTDLVDRDAANIWLRQQIMATETPC
ncbi:LysR family transcriptional regulator [Rouxiella sp. Mn2063]|uniref:LysR family transcriptional regulator n=1 Tax=Rouxiella sp. Mn2063 TaxID=3395262 RepID=UPI003BE6137E